MKNMKFFVLAFAAMIVLTGTTFAAITFVDATDGPTGNTTLAAGGVWSSVNPGVASDNLWRARPGFGNGMPSTSAVIFESSGQSANGTALEDCPRLKTTVTGLADGTYDVYAYFWTGNNPVTATNQFWLLRAGLTNLSGDLPLYGYLRSPTTGLTDYVTPDIASTLPLTTDFTAPVTVIDTSARYMNQAYLGQQLVVGGVLTAYIDDYASANTVNKRTWFDGIGYQAVPEPATWIMMVLGAMGIALYSRKK